MFINLCVTHGLTLGNHCPQLAGQLTPTHSSVHGLRHERGGRPRCVSDALWVRDILAQVQLGEAWTGDMIIGLVHVLSAWNSSQE